MSSLLHQAAQKAVELADAVQEDGCCMHWKEVVKFLRELSALQQQPEPVAWLVTGGRTYNDRAYIPKEYAEREAADRRDGSKAVPLYTASPALQHQEVPREPVAWLKRSARGVLLRTNEAMNDTPEGEDGVTRCGWEPLYASPSTTQQQEAGNESMAVVRKALAEVAEGYNEANCAMCKGRGFYGIPGGPCTFCHGKGRVRWRSNAAPSTPESAEKDDAGGGKGYPDAQP